MENLKKVFYGKMALRSSSNYLGSLEDIPSTEKEDLQNVFYLKKAFGITYLPRRTS